MQYILWVRIEVILHATEDLDRFLDKFQEWLELDGKALEKELKLDHLTGTFGNPIRLLTFKTQKNAIVKQILARLSLGLSSEIKNTLFDELSVRLDPKRVFHLRLDKDLFLQDTLDLSQGNDIVLELKFKKYYKGKDLRDQLEDVFRKLFGA